MKNIFILLVFILNSFLFGQNYSEEQLDSIFTEYLQIKAPDLISVQDKRHQEDTLADKCGLGTVNFVRMNMQLFSQQQQIIINKLTSRFVNQKSAVSNSGFFRIHYDTVGTNVPRYNSTLTAYQNVMLVAEALDSSYNFEVNYLGYPPPPPDDTAGSDNLYDIYITELGSGLYGYTEYENETAPGNGKLTSFMVIDNDYSGSFATTGINGARVTVAHEFHHGIQGGNYLFRDVDRYFYEITSTAMEEFVYDSINDYYAYMGSYFNNAGASFSTNNGYNLAIWNIFLKDRFGFDIIKRQWELMPQMRAVNAIANSLIEYNSSFRTEFNKFGVWTFFTKSRRIPGMYFEEAQSYPLMKTGTAINFTPPQDTVNGSSMPIANNFFTFVNHTKSPSDTLVVLISNSDLVKGVSSPGLTTPFSYSLHTDSIFHSVKLAQGYYAYFNPDNPGIWAESEFLNRSLVREDTTVVVPLKDIVDFVFPNPFIYNKTGQYIYFTVPDEVGTELNLNIYTSAMELVYETRSLVMSYNGFKVIPWDVRNVNKRLGSGVYIYAIKSGDEIQKGKLVIFND